jgi:parallel beta-helix repeat protein
MRLMRLLLATVLGAAMLAVVAEVPAADAQSGQVIWVSPGDDLQNAIGRAGVNGTVVLRTGVYRGQTLTPKTGQRIVGQSGAVLDGEGKAGGAIVGTRGNHRVTIENLEVRNYRAGNFFAAVQVDGPANNRSFVNGWRLLNLNVHHNLGHGVNLGNGAKLLRSRIHHNTQLGVGGYFNTNPVIRGNTIYQNNTRNNDSGNHAGGIKLISASRPIIQNNYVHHNRGPGIWCDIGCGGAVIANNTVTDHVHDAAAGIQMELSSNALIRDNTIRNCGRFDESWLWGAGILVDVSSNIRVVRNRVVDCDSFVGVIQQDASSRDAVAGLSGRVNNIRVTDNIFRANKGNGKLNRIGVVEDTGDPSVFDRNFRFVRNAYTGAEATTYVFDGDFFDRSRWRSQYGWDQGAKPQGNVGASGRPAAGGPVSNVRLPAPTA